MGGDLILASTTLGAGTRFLLTVPATAVAPLAEPAGRRAGGGIAGDRCRGDAAGIRRGGRRRSPPTPAPPDWKPAILVCDDSPDIRQLLSVVLDRAGAEAILAPTGEDAVASVGDAAARRGAARSRPAGDERPGRGRAPAHGGLRWTR